MRSTRPLAQLAQLAHLTRVTLTSPSPFVRRRGAVTPSPALEGDFTFFPSYYTPSESRILLQAALWKLDRGDYTRRRRRRGASPKPEVVGGMLQDMFSGEYGFEEGHFDSVIHQYRESLFSTLPPTPELAPVLARLYALVPGLVVPKPEEATMADFPVPGSSTHVLHLSPRGAILPHVDNVDASGQTIVGASLGASRVLRLEHKDTGAGWDVLLPSGSVYIQKGEVRYTYKHSILGYDADGSEWDGERLVPGHRVSFMVRDAPTGPPAQL